MSARVEDGTPLARQTSRRQRAAASAVRKAAASSPGLDLICTKVAVDFQSITAERPPSEFTAGLQALTEACGADSIFVALVDDAGRQLRPRSTRDARRSRPATPRCCKGRQLDEFPWIKARLEHLRLLEIKDTAERVRCAAATMREQLASLNVGALLFVGFNIRGRLGGMLGVLSAAPNPEWSAELQLALKLLGASCASGLERIELTEDLADVQERDRLVTNTANDGLWDYDVRENSMYFSPRWRAMLGYANDHDVPEWRLLVHPDDLAHVQTQLREHLEGRTELFESVHRMQHASGEWRWIQSRVQGPARRQRAPEAARRRRNRHHGTQALRGSAVPREGERADHAAVDRRRRGHDRRRGARAVPESGGLGAHGLAAR